MSWQSWYTESGRLPLRINDRISHLSRGNDSEKKREWQRTLPGLNGYLWGHCLFPPYCRAICSHEDASSPSRHSSRFWWLLADTVWLISFHDLINHSISSQRRINIVLKWAISTKRRALTTTQHTVAGARRLARTDARALDKYAEELVISPLWWSVLRENPSAKGYRSES